MTRARPLWLMTLADLALLLLGFMILIHSAGERTRAELAGGIRQAFAGEAAAALPAPPAPAGMALDVNGVDGFALASAALPGDVGPLVDWAVEAAGDPRAVLRVTGEADRGEGLGLAARRAAAVAEAIERDGRVDPTRLRLDARTGDGTRRVLLAISYGI